MNHKDSKIQRLTKALVACLVVVQCLPAPAQTRETRVEVKPTWPRPIPCRTRDGENKDLVVMTLGDVSTPVANATYDPLKDEVKLSDGTVINNYYRDSLGVKYFKPIDKTRFPLPPSGWGRLGTRVWTSADSAQNSVGVQCL